MNPQTVKIPKTLPLATTDAGGNVIPPTTNSVAPPLIDWNLLAATHASYATAPFVAIARMISVIIGASPSKIVVQGEEVATMPSPTILMRSALDACFASHVDALGEEEEGASAFEEAVRSFLSFMPLLVFIPPHRKCHALTYLSNYQMLRGLGGADANRMKSMTFETPQTHTPAEIHVSGDIALGSVGKFAVSLASEEVVRY